MKPTKFYSNLSETILISPGSLTHDFRASFSRIV